MRLALNLGPGVHAHVKDPPQEDFGSTNEPDLLKAMLTLSTECRLIFPIRLGKYDTSIGVTVASFLSAKKRLQNTVREYSRLRRGFQH